MKNNQITITTILFFFVLSGFHLKAQTTGQFLLNGDFSFFNNHDKSDRSINEQTISGELIPARDYVFQQYASNLTLNPRLHYFLNDKWSVGIAMGFRQIITRRFINEFMISAPSDYIAFSITSKVQNTAYNYSPKIEVSRNWKLNNKFSINLTGLVNWRWVTLIIDEAEELGLTKTDEVSTWSVSSDGLTYKVGDPESEQTKSKEQYWSIGLSPQLRFAITPRFGLSATIGGISLSQKVKDDTENFVRSAPNLGIIVNPNSWTLGVYGIFGGAKEEQE